MHIILSLILTLISNVVIAGTFAQEYTYSASDIDNEVSSRIIAVDHVRDLLLNNIKSRVKSVIKISETGTTDTYSKIEVDAVAACITEITILEEKWYGNEFYVKAQVNDDIRNIVNILEKYKKDTTEQSQQLLKSLILNERELVKTREKFSIVSRSLKFSTEHSHSDKSVSDYMDTLNKIKSITTTYRGLAYHLDGQYNESADIYRKLAAQGNSNAQQLIGTLYAHGQGLEKNLNKASDYFQRSANQGNPIAQYLLGMMLFNGNGVNQNYAEAFSWIKKSAEQGDSLSQFQLGNLYLNGKGVEKRDYMAIYWYRKSAEHNLVDSQRTLSKLYSEGIGVSQNDDESKYWARIVADNISSKAKI